MEANFDERPQSDKTVVKLDYNVFTSNNTLLFSNNLEYKITTKEDNFLKSNASLIYLPYIYNLKENTLLFHIKILNPENLKHQIKSFNIQLETNNEKFFYFFWYLKWLLFGLSIYTTSKFIKSYREQLKQTRSLEQSHIIVLGILLIIYNYPVSFYINETHPTIYFILITSFINILFYSYVIYFWLTTFEVK